jgi:dephospho-CoA kinase
MKKVIGVVGHPSSGKDTVAEYLKGKGFEHFSSGDVIRENMKEKGLSVDRTSMHHFAKEMRRIHGNQYPADVMVGQIKNNSVISGIRNSAEHGLFKKEFKENFILIAVDAPIEFRYQMARSRGRVGDDVTFEKFREEEERERQAESGTHEVDKVIGFADTVITNDSTLEDLYKKVDKFLKLE